MPKSIHNWTEDLEENPTRTVFKGCLIWLVILAILSMITGTGLYFAGWFSEAAAVTQSEFGSRALLDKYTWFKDAAAALDKKSADITLYKQRLASFEEAYADTPRKDWDRTDKEQWAQMNTELLGVQASYNSLASQYNAAMAKDNWAFTNVGALPAGGDPLPREFRTYEGSE
jgi:hypothetical protein